MFGIRFIKVQPTTYLLQYNRGRSKREGRGLAFFYFEPFTSLVAVPMESVDVPFIFNQITADFQSVTLQGQVTYRVIDPKQLAQLLNFTLDSKTRNYLSEDPQNLPQRVINSVQVLMQNELNQLTLRETLKSSSLLVQNVLTGLGNSKEINSLGLEVLGLSLLAISPTPETARALEAEMREQLLKEADQAIYSRRNAAVEQERAIRENELDTEIAVEQKQRQVRETQMEAERSIKEKERLILDEGMTGKIALEKRNRELVDLTMENAKCEAETRAYQLGIIMKVFGGVDAKVLQSLASMNMNPSRLIALAFRDLAANAERIGHLNISPDLLSELINSEVKSNVSNLDGLDLDRL